MGANLPLQRTINIRGNDGTTLPPPISGDGFVICAPLSRNLLHATTTADSKGQTVDAVEVNGLELILDDDLREAFPNLLAMPREKLMRLLRGDFLEVAQRALSVIDAQPGGPPPFANV